MKQIRVVCEIKFTPIFDYVYDENFAHRLVRAGDRYYKYDANGNITVEQDGSFDSDETVSYHKITREADGVYSTDYGWGLFAEESGGGGNGTSSVQKYKRTYTWNERNQLVSSVDSNYATAYIYGADGQRSNKYTASSETLYFNKMWTLHTDSGNSVYGGQSAKNIYLGETRIVTKLAGANETTAHEEYYKQYFYHSDHLGSASLISDYKGDEYQRIEYTPYGETWVEKTQNTGLEFLPYKFTGKEIDEETGLYYYGARYLDPKYSRWISTDPALSDYIPVAPVNNEAKRHNQNLPGLGGIYNSVNLQLYHYAGNNPVKYTDPDGKFDANTFFQFANETCNKAQTVAIADSPAPGPCDVLAAGMIVVAAGAAVIGGGIELCNFIRNKIEERAIAKSIAKAEEKTSDGHLMYHYTTVPPEKWSGPLRPGNYITPNGNYSGKEADNKLALPKGKNGNDRIPTY